MNLCLGIESTAHTFGIAIVTFDGKVLANVKDAVSLTSGGMIPSEVAQHHVAIKEKMLGEVFSKAGVRMKDITLIAYSRGPGLAPCLRVGRDFAKQLAQEHHKPLIGVNHCIAHLTIGDFFAGSTDPVYVYVSGVNTQIVALAAGVMRVFGETLDIGLGNALDKFGREAGLGFPAGPKIEERAKKGSYVELPYSVKGMDVSFSGMITKATQLLKKGELVENMCYSLQETCFAMLVEVTERALAHTGKQEVVLIGGVAANQRLCEMMKIMCEARNTKFYPVPIQYSGDQGAMIAWQGILEWNAEQRNDVELAEIYPYERTDDIHVTWRKE